MLKKHDDGDICNTFNAKDFLKNKHEARIFLWRFGAYVVVRHGFSRVKRQESCGLKI